MLFRKYLYLLPIALFFFLGLFSSASAFDVTFDSGAGSFSGNLTSGFDDYTMFIFDVNDSWCGTAPCAKFKHDSPYNNNGTVLNTDLSFSQSPTSSLNYTNGQYVAVFVDDDPSFGFPAFPNRNLTNFLAAYSSDIDNYFYFESETSGNFEITCVGDVGSTDTCVSAGSQYATTTEYVFINFDVATTTCNTSSSGTVCTHQYSTSTDNFATAMYNLDKTLQTIFLFALWLSGFLLVFMCIKWLIRPRYEHY